MRHLNGDCCYSCLLLQVDDIERVTREMTLHYIKADRSCAVSWNSGLQSHRDVSCRMRNSFFCRSCPCLQIVQDPRTIILCVIPANQDPQKGISGPGSPCMPVLLQDMSVSDALQLARQVDPQGMRSAHLAGTMKECMLKHLATCSESVAW